MERMSPVEFKQWLEKRTRAFAISVFHVLDELPYCTSTKVIAFQLGKSASSIGANYHEANRAESRDDFIHKVFIALKEASESCYWLGMLIELRPEYAKLKAIYSESIEIRNLLQSIVSSAKSSSPNKATKSVS